MKRLQQFEPPIDHQVLLDNDFFKLYPFDGGGSFINAEILGSLDDVEAVRNIMNGALDDFGHLPELDFAKYERWRSIEKSCWINRFYFIVPLARAACLFKNRELASVVVEIMLHFIRNYPAPQGRDAIGEHINYVYHIRDNDYNRHTWVENQRDETDVQYIWFDFQPGSRIIHFIYALYFIRDVKCFESGQLEEIEASLREHAELIRLGEKHFLELEVSANHQSLRAVALFFAAAYFQDDSEFSKKLTTEAARVASFHITEDYFADGVLRENSPSYHMFETWHVRDAMVLGSRLGAKMPEQGLDILRRAVEYIIAVRQPDARSITINDGYGVELDPFLCSFPSEVVADMDYETRTFCFPDAGMAFYRDADYYIGFDYSKYPGRFSHYHGGKNGVTLFFQDEPFLVDSACCSYDDPDFGTHYKQPEAHCSMLIDGAGDAEVSGIYNWQSWAVTESSGWHDNEIGSVLTSNRPGWENVVWHRQLIVKPDGSIVIKDKVANLNGRTAIFVFNMHPQVLISRREFSCLLISSDASMDILFDSNMPFTLDELAGKCFVNNAHVENRQLQVKIAPQAGTVSLKTVFTPVD
jgi:Heparinase II/III-like protein/Heparinase II/III N-terminus